MSKWLITICRILATLGFAVFFVLALTHVVGLVHGGVWPWTNAVMMVAIVVSAVFSLLAHHLAKKEGIDE